MRSRSCVSLRQGREPGRATELWDYAQPAHSFQHIGNMFLYFNAKIFACKYFYIFFFFGGGSDELLSQFLNH